jgi:hypothetical protein
MQTPTDIIKGAREHSLTVVRAKRIHFLTPAGRCLWSVGTLAAARRFLRTCDLQPSHIEQLVRKA